MIAASVEKLRGGRGWHSSVTKFPGRAANERIVGVLVEQHGLDNVGAAKGTALPDLLCAFPATTGQEHQQNCPNEYAENDFEALNGLIKALPEAIRSCLAGNRRHRRQEDHQNG